VEIVDMGLTPIGRIIGIRTIERRTPFLYIAAYLRNTERAISSRGIGSNGGGAV
jgi:hypothetical protein